MRNCRLIRRRNGNSGVQSSLNCTSCESHGGTQNSQDLKLHVFCDSSEKAYSAVACLQGERKDGELTIRLVAYKSRVAPLKRVTLPCLWLMGAVIAARLGSILMKAL